MILGLTGGMGCGKTAAAEVFAELGWGVVDSDATVRELLREDEATRREVAEAFGSEVIAADDGVDRHKLAAIVFRDAAALARLEGILHPRVAARRRDAIAADPGRNWVAEIPLLFEKGLEKEVDFTVCIACDPRVQAQRLASRGLSPQEADRRIARQLPLAQKMERADFVITNNGSPAFLRDQVIQLVEQLSPPVA
jgi:dephospho-CoA kinase